MMVFVAAQLVVVGQTKELTLPGWRIMQLLGEGRDQWLSLERGERPPVEVDAGPYWVRWASPWPDRPDDEILIEATDDSLGARLRWTLFCPEGDRPDEDLVRERRHRMNELLNEQLRDFVDAEG
jgi:hypothetical protein